MVIAQLEAVDAFATKLIVRGVCIAVRDDNIDVADLVVPGLTRLNSQAVSTIIIGQAACWNFDTRLGVCAVGLGWCAQAFIVDAIVRVWT